MKPIIDVGIIHLFLALILVLLVLAISYRERLGLERDLIIATARTFLQLFLVGYFLIYLFASDRWELVLLTLIVMLSAASWIAVGRLEHPLPGARWIAVASLVVGSAITLGFVTQVVIQVEPWYDPRYLIPIGGMILGNAMTGAALAGERFQGELRSRVEEVETLLALGFSGMEATRDLYRSALRAAMIPTINAMLAVGIVQLPGMMTGQILSGTSPLIAVKYQVVVMLMITCAVALSSFLFLHLAVKRYFTPAHQLRRQLIL
ncbi:MAG: iron export ABC transporter permease subunit FetB [candidate division NC10 bacterium]|jgi:putative ABC transport system permease protein|nr:iron export ABC transporter permease subunit FetB [candidate division NC10 bacterium]